MRLKNEKKLFIANLQRNLVFAVNHPIVFSGLLLKTFFYEKLYYVLLKIKRWMINYHQRMHTMHINFISFYFTCFTTMARTLRIISKICRIFSVVIVEVLIFIPVIRIYETETNNRQLMLLYIVCIDQKKLSKTRSIINNIFPQILHIVAWFETLINTNQEIDTTGLVSIKRAFLCYIICQFSHFYIEQLQKSYSIKSWTHRNYSLQTWNRR